MNDPSADGRAVARRPGFVRFQQHLARQALLFGCLGAARAAMRVLICEDFAGGAASSEAALAILRSSRSRDEDVLDALDVLIHLPAATS